MTKKLILMISTEGKTPEQYTKEAWDAFQKYQKVAKEVEWKSEGNIMKRMAVEPVYYMGDSVKFRTIPPTEGSSLRVFKKLGPREIEVNGSDDSFCKALAYFGWEITKEDYDIDD